MAKKKIEKDEEIEEIPKEEEEKKPELPKSTRVDGKPYKKELKATEWAKEDPDKPDYHLFIWHDSKGVIPKEKYEEIKKTLVRDRR